MANVYDAKAQKLSSALASESKLAPPLCLHAQVPAHSVVQRAMYAWVNLGSRKSAAKISSGWLH